MNEELLARLDERVSQIVAALDRIDKHLQKYADKLESHDDRLDAHEVRILHLEQSEHKVRNSVRAIAGIVWQFVSSIALAYILLKMGLRQ